MSTLTQNKVPLEFLLTEGDGHFSRENITVLSGEGKLVPGTVLGKTVAAGAATVSAKSGNTGNGVFTIDGSTPVLGNAKRGRYVAECIEPGSNVGTFQVTDPDGIVLGSHVVAGSAFSNGIKFAIADGSTDFVSGDAFFIDVTVSSFKYRVADPTYTDGSAVACAVLGYAVDATSADASGVVIARHAEVKVDELTYAAGVDNATKKATKVAELAKVGIIVR